MAQQNTALIEVLNDLIQINYDRVEGYRNAGEESKDDDISLHPLFLRMADQSRLNVSALTKLVNQLGGEVKSGTTAMGKIYRAWMNIKDAFTGKDRHTILASCEFGEDQAQQAYHAAFVSDAEMPSDIRQILLSQQEQLEASHDEIKSLRNATV